MTILYKLLSIISEWSYITTTSDNIASEILHDIPIIAKAFVDSLS